MSNKFEQHSIRECFGSFKDSDAFVVGTGTSLSGFKWERMKSKTPIIALNDAVKIEGLNPHFHIFSDINIWKRYRDMDMPPRTKVVCQRKAKKEFLRWEGCSFKDRVYHFNQVGTCDAVDPEIDDLYIKNTVATGGIGLAWKLGARRIFLMGVDGFKLEEVYYHDGTSKGPEKRKVEPLGDGRWVQDRHRWWQKNMWDLRKYFNARKLFLGPWPESGVYILGRSSTIDAFQRLKYKTIFGRTCFRTEDR